jgi:hypothetical protein
MEPGFMLDRRRNYGRAALWVSGEPEPSFWFGVKTGGGRKRITVSAFRCPRCGRLEMYAPEA